MTDYQIADISGIGPRVEIIEILWVGPSLNDILRANWRRYGEAKKAAKHACHVAMRNIKPFTVPVRLEFSHVMGRNARRQQLPLYDCCNYGITNKIIEDILVSFKILEDDRCKFVVGVSTLTPVKGPHSVTILKIIEV